MKVALLHNHQAGDREHTRKQLHGLLRRHGYEPVPLDLERANRRTCQEAPGDFVIVAGGDGSVKRAAAAFAGSGRALAILPIGTANNIAHSLGVSGSTEQIVAGWPRCKPVAVDLGIARGPWGRRYFIESVGVGLIGRAIAIMHGVERVSAHAPARREDRLHRDLCVLLALIHELRPVPLRLQLDGRRARRGRFLVCDAMNIRHSGPGLELGRGADPTDGLFDVVSVEAKDRHKLIHLIERCLAGKAPAPRLDTQRVRRVHLTLGRHELRLDDEVVWPPQTISRRSPQPRRIAVTLEIVPGALECLLPRSKNKNV